MGKYVLAYLGGALGGTPEEQQKTMEDWMSWFGTLGEAIVDPGAPFGPEMTVNADGSISETGECRITGYSIISADSQPMAADLAKSCPVLNSGGSVEVYEALPIG